jgi:hypothetical protein
VIDRPKKTEEQKNDKVDNVKGQNHKGERNQGDRKPGQGYRGKPKLVYKEKIEVTLDTVIPELPKKDQRLSMPDDEAHQKELDKIAKQIDELYKKMVIRYSAQTKIVRTTLPGKPTTRIINLLTRDIMTSLTFLKSSKRKEARLMKNFMLPTVKKRP